MARLSTLGPGGGINFKDPKYLFPFVAASGDIANVSGTGASVATAAAFFDNLTSNGLSVDSDYVADTPKTIIDVTGGGEIFAVIGPTAGGAETTTFEFVLDGVTYTYAFVCASGDRAGMWAAHSLGAFTTTANVVNSGFSSLDATKVINKTAAFSWQLPGWFTLGMMGTPRLEFKLAARVRITHSANVSGTDARERRSGVGYRMHATSST